MATCKQKKEVSKSKDLEEELEYDDESSGLDEEENVLLYKCAEFGDQFSDAALQEA